MGNCPVTEVRERDICTALAPRPRTKAQLLARPETTTKKYRRSIAHPVGPSSQARLSPYGPPRTL